MTIGRRTLWVAVWAALSVGTAGWPAADAHADGGVILDAAVRETYESNVNGSPAAANRKDDEYATTSGLIGFYTSLGASRRTYLVGKVGAQRSVFNEFNTLNNTVALATLGLYHRFDPVVSAQLTAKGAMKEYVQTARDAESVGGALELKQQLTPRVWIKEGADYERNEANARSLNYDGYSAGVWIGYLPVRSTLLSAGYSFLRRDYAEVPGGFETNTHTISASLGQRLFYKLYLNAGYDYQINDSSLPGTEYRNHVVSAGLSLSF